MVKQAVPTRRCYATPDLRRQLALQGRMAVWVARQVGISKSLMSRVISGEVSMSEDNARKVALLLGCDFFSLFELPSGSVSRPVGNDEESAA